MTQLSVVSPQPDLPWPSHPAAGLFPLLTDAELQDLADDIKANGLHEPVWTWEDPERGTVLLDGRNRILACQLAGAEIIHRQYHGTDPIGFIVSENIRRRHLTAGQRAFLALGVEQLYAASTKRGRPPKVTEVIPVSPPGFPAAEERQAGQELYGPGAFLQRNQETRADLHEFTPYERRSEARAAKATGASGRAVAQAKRITEQAPDLAEQVRSGKMAIDQADRVIRNREAEERRTEQAAAAVMAQPVRLATDIRHGDFRAVFGDLCGVHAVITDPPYGREYLPLLGDLARWAARVLGPDGVLAVLYGQTWLPEAYAQLGSGPLAYRWTGCWLAPGAGYVSHDRRVSSQWKPVLVYGGGPRFHDVFRSGDTTGTDAKQLHEWGQDLCGFSEMCGRLSAPGQLVADPFCGSGTTLLAARLAGCHVAGCDISEAAVTTTRQRLGLPG